MSPADEITAIRNRGRRLIAVCSALINENPYCFSSYICENHSSSDGADYVKGEQQAILTDK
ncbi:hypothetical protein NQ317_010913 [Molorchus minor]|uniref:Uncharacterized protein n=1 Tax=Molorchus minor TaxID=1323400 RepID=A0ABQ9JA34_9CUCU|nr:hypothetical protein NQ317_010913 [Molorchus minor]